MPEKGRLICSWRCTRLSVFAGGRLPGQGWAGAVRRAHLLQPLQPWVGQPRSLLQPLWLAETQLQQDQDQEE